MTIDARPPLTVLTEEEVMFRDAVRDFAETEIRPRVQKMDEAQRYDDDLIPKMFEMGLMGIEVPEALGGSGGTFFQSILAVEEISAVDAAVGVLVDVQNTLFINALLRKEAGQREDWPLGDLGFKPLYSFNATGGTQLPDPNAYLEYIRTGNWEKGPWGIGSHAGRRTRDLFFLINDGHTGGVIHQVAGRGSAVVLLIVDAKRRGRGGDLVGGAAQPDEARIEVRHVLRQRLRRIALGIHGHHHHLDFVGLAPETLQPLRQLGEGGGTNIRAIGVAEVEHRQLVPKVAELHRLAVRTIQGEIGDGLRRLHRKAVIVVGQQPRQEQPGGNRHSQHS